MTKLKNVLSKITIPALFFFRGYYVLFNCMPRRYQITNVNCNPIGKPLSITHRLHSERWINFFCRDKLHYERIINGLHADKITIISTIKKNGTFVTTFQPCL